MTGFQTFMLGCILMLVMFGFISVTGILVQIRRDLKNIKDRPL